jgi:hypothetical protein
MTVEVDPKDILGRVKVEVCERESVDPRTKCVIRGSSKKDVYVLGSQNKLPDSEWQLDPRVVRSLSHHDLINRLRRLGYGPEHHIRLF